MKKFIIIGVIVILGLILFFSGKSSYNGFVSMDQSVEEQWAKVQVQYQRRMDLIPNIMRTVQGYAAHEKETYEAVTRARAGLSDALTQVDSLKQITPEQTDAFENYNATQDRLNKALSIYVNAVREAYPDLKAVGQFDKLSVELEGTENRIATERGRYTEIVRQYNTKVKSFPANIWASVFGFSAKPQFQADAAASQAPTVQF